MLRKVHFFFLVGITAFFTLFCSCTKKEGKKKIAAYSIIDTKKIYFSRAYERDNGILTLEFLQAAKCKVEYWPESANQQNISSLTLTSKCAFEDPQQKVTERLSNLNQSESYIFKISAWVQDGGPVEVYVAKEGSVDPYQPMTEPYGEIFVNRLDIPLKTAQIHRYSFTSQNEAIDFSKNLKRETGCTQDLEKIITYFKISEPSPNIKLSKLSTRGLASANGENHPFNVDMQQLSYETLQFGDKWEITYELANTSYRLLAPQLNYFESFVVTGLRSQELSAVNLQAPNVAVAVNPNASLSFSWRLSKNASNEQILLLFEAQKNKDNQILCVFDAKDGKGQLDFSGLSRSIQDNINLSVYLEQRLFIPVEGGSTHSWLIQAYDWRHAVLNKT